MLLSAPILVLPELMLAAKLQERFSDAIFIMRFVFDDININVKGLLVFKLA